MLLPQPLVHGRLVSRYKRFFADLVLDDGREITAHCPNPGAMLGLKDPGRGAWVSWSDDPKRKLAWTLQLVEQGNVLVGVNTLLPNKLVAEALAQDLIPELSGYATIRPEVKYAEASRVDFLLTHPDRPPCWLEVKNCHFSPHAGPGRIPRLQGRALDPAPGDLAAQVARGPPGRRAVRRPARGLRDLPSLRRPGPGVRARAGRSGQGGGRGAGLCLRDEHGDGADRTADCVERPGRMTAN
jgi:sugar fermentation stimulation protein A